ncbi:hypothetical protein BDN71DRAFT_1450554 [Pleurotus eryngii]|uniref:Uncharacterized protein n=1 Tax=Pleurotus eryngii TaxID=5323 RepID=A0A9P5ZSK0_PLEER|nr:hypothetical protein BDN71DRAFT_1450554 [Pleurotus eryngii]
MRNTHTTTTSKALGLSMGHRNIPGDRSTGQATKQTVLLQLLAVLAGVVSHVLTEGLQVAGLPDALTSGYFISFDPKLEVQVLSWPYYALKHRPLRHAVLEEGAGRFRPSS